MLLIKELSLLLHRIEIVSPLSSILAYLQRLNLSEEPFRLSGSKDKVNSFHRSHNFIYKVKAIM